MIPYFGNREELVELTIRAGWRGTDENLRCGYSDVRNNTWSCVDASRRRAHDWDQSPAHAETASASFGWMVALGLSTRSRSCSYSLHPTSPAIRPKRLSRWTAGPRRAARSVKH